MKTQNNTDQFLDTLASYFKKEHKKVRNNIALSAYAILRSETVNTAEIARHMGEVNNLNFKSNDMRIYRLLKSKNFHVNDRLWRGHISLLFNLMKESGLKKGKEIVINVDFTSDRDDYLILCASIVFQEESIPIYFSMRNYPKRSGMFDQKKMEEAFFKALRHLLPDSYTYTIVADRGFGNNRIIKILENLKFNYVLRLQTNLLIEYQKKMMKAKHLPHRNMTISNAYVNAWSQKIRIVKHVEKEASWVLAVSLKLMNPVKKYTGRFSIEKMFKNTKSGGFDLEKLLINKYDRFKRMLFISCLAYTLLMFTGFLINNRAHPIKKNYFLHLKLLTAFSD